MERRLWAIPVGIVKKIRVETGPDVETLRNRRGGMIEFRVREEVRQGDPRGLLGTRIFLLPTETWGSANRPMREALRGRRGAHNTKGG